MARKRLLHVEIVGLSRWAYGDGDLVLEAGVHQVDVSDDPELEQAIRDAADAKVGVRLLKRGK